MKNLCCLLFTLCAPLWLHALDREAFTFTKYDLSVRVEAEQQRLGVRGKITLRNDSGAPQRNVTLQISSSLHWSSITFEGKPVEYVTQPYISDIDHTGALSEAIVVLPQPVAPKQTVELEIGYEGVISLDATRLTRIGVPEDTAKRTDWDQISRTFSAVRGVGYVAWYPIATEAASLGDGSEVQNAIARWQRREVTAEMKAAFNFSGEGDEAKLLCNGSQTAQSYGRMDRANNDAVTCDFGPLSTLSPLFVTGVLDLLNRPEMSILYLPEHRSGAEDYSAAVDEVTPLITKWLGDHRDKMGTKADAIDLPDKQAATYDSENVLLMPLGGSDTKLLLAATQQIAQIYFPSPQIWIHEGLSSYAQARLIEEKEGTKPAIAYLQAHIDLLQGAEREVSAQNDGNSLVNATDKLLVRTKAMYVWWMLRDMIGESAFDAALNSYKAADDRSATYMQKLIETESHRDLQWFFDDWVYHDHGLPDFRIASVYPSSLPNGGYMATVTVENLGDAGAEVPITLHMQGGQASGRLVVRAKSKASVRIEAPSFPQSVTVNDGSVPESDMSNNQYTLSH